MKTAVYTIAKNEENNVARFMESCKGVDYIAVLDTGSTDQTIKLLRDGGAIVEKAEITPFDYGKARQIALDMVPKDADWCISIDLDETLEPGWREELEKVEKDVGLIDYLYIETKDGISSFRSKIHRRNGWKWEQPIHEKVVPTDDREVKRLITENIVVKHHRTTPNNYIEQLNKYIKEKPEVADSYIQRGADYLTAGEYDKAIADYKKYLELSFSDDREMVKSRRSYSWLSIAQALHKKESTPGEILQTLLFAAAENPDSREAWTYLAEGWQAVDNYPQAYGCAMTALSIQNRGVGAKVDLVWGDYPKQIASRAITKIMSRLGINNK